MKRRLITVLTLSLLTANSVFAEFSYVDSADFTGDAFFTPPALQEKQQDENESIATKTGVKHSIPPLKKLRLVVKKKLKERDAFKNELAPVAPQEDIYAAGTETSEYASKDLKEEFDDTMMPDGFEADEESISEQGKKHFWQRNTPKAKNETDNENKESIILDCENIDYDTDSYSVVATGNANVDFVEQKTTLKADKITYDRLNNTVKAEGNVKILKNGQTITGEYIFVDMNEENALIEKPVAQNAQFEMHAQKGYVYGDKIVQENGSMEVSDSFPINFRSLNNGPLLSKMIMPKDRSLTEDMENGRIRVKVKDIKITQKGDLETIALKNTTVFKGTRKLVKLPPVKVYTNKNFDFFENSSWEIGSFRGLGMYLGPSHVFEVPGGSILKVMPILNYKSGIGVGGIVRFVNASNWTQAAYGTAAGKFMVRGQQKLDDHLSLQYVMNDYMREWFLGRRRAKYGAALVYENGYSQDGFLLKGQNSSFSHRVDFGYYQDMEHDKSYGRNDGGSLGTIRTRYMAQANQNFYTHINEEKQTSLTLGIVGQMSAALYGTGDTQVIGRLGPVLHTQYKRWMQDIGYFQSAYEDNTPMPVFDSYRYGKSNFYLREYIRLNRYLALSWFGSYNLSNDSPNGKSLQENTFYVTFGPEDVKFSIGYDAERETTKFLVEVMMDAKGTKLDYDRMEIKQEKKSEKKNEISDDSDFQKSTKPPVLQYAVVEDVKNMEDVL